MKKHIFIILGVLNYIISFSQNNEGVIIEYNKEIDVEYLTYNPPLRINQVKKQSKIDYSKIEGLLQSRFSAHNKEWDISDYLNKEQNKKKDDEFYNSLKSRDFKKSYIQLETVYKFNYDNREFAYIKYSKIMDKAPFPFIGTLSLEKVNNRWYINYLYNQTNIFHIFSNLEPKVLDDLFKLKSDNSQITNIIKKARGSNGRFDFSLMSIVFDSLMKNKESRKLIRDKRLTILNYEFRNAIYDANPTKNIYKVNHPFLLESTIFKLYATKYKNLIKNKKTTNQFLGKPESVLLKKIPITLINKFCFIDGNKKYFIIKYLDNTMKKTVTITQENDSFKVLKLTKYKKWEKFFLQIKGNFFIDLFQSSNINLKELKNKVKGNSSGINIDLLNIFFNKNQSKFQKYLDK